MNVRLRSLLIELLTGKNIVESWGISSIDVSDNSVAFSVAGFQYQGRVVLEIKPDGYSIRRRDKILPCIVLEKVIPTLDILIEAGDAYYKDIMNWMNRRLSRSDKQTCGTLTLSNEEKLSK